MMPSAHLRVRRLCCVALALIAAAHAIAAEPMPGAGGSGHACFIWAPPGASRSRAEHISSIHHIPATEPLGAVRLGRQIAGWPATVAMHAERLLLIHEPDRSPVTGGDAPGPPSNPNRRVEALTIAPAVIGSGFFEFRPVGRDPETLPSLPGEGALLDAVMTDRGAFALLAVGDEMRLLRLDGAQWTAVAIPRTPRAASPTLAAHAERLILAERRPASPDAGPRAWIASADDLADESEGDAAAPNDASDFWSPSPYAPPDVGERLLSAGGSLLGWVSIRADFGPGAVALRLFRPDGRAHPLARIDGVGADYAVVPVADRVNVVWFEPAPSGPRRRITVVSAITGQTLFSGPATQGAIVSGRSLLTLALLLGAVLLTALVFILRPDPAGSQIVVLPPGTALAGPGRRFFAALIDIGLPAILISRAVGVPLGDMLSASLFAPDAGLRGAGALLALVFVVIAHTSLSEWLAGSTLGKRALGCRTVSVTGTKPALWQAFVRNVLKMLCPPLALFLVIDARARHPADILAKTVVVVGVRPPPDANAPPGDGA